MDSEHLTCYKRGPQRLESAVLGTFVTSSFLLRVARPGAPLVAPLLLVVRPGAPSSFLFLLVRHLLLEAMHLLLVAFLLLVAMLFVTSSRFPGPCVALRAVKESAAHCSGACHLLWYKRFGRGFELDVISTGFFH